MLVFAYRLIPLCVRGVWLWSVCVFYSLCLVQPQMCTQPAPRPHTYYHSVLPSSILPNSIKASPPGVCIVNQALTIRPWLDPTHIQKTLDLFIHLSSFAWHQNALMSDQGDMPTSNCYSLHLQVRMLSNRPRQARLNEIFFFFLFFEARLCRCCAAHSILRGDTFPLPHPQTRRSSRESVKVICHGSRKVIRHNGKTGPRWPSFFSLFFHEYAQGIFREASGC